MANKKIITLNNLNQYSGKVDTKYVKKAGDSFTGIMNVEGALNLPNSPDNPETAQVTNTYNIRKTANSDVTGLTVVDNSTTEILKVEGNTVRTLNEFDISKIKNQSNLYPSGNNIVIISSYAHSLGGTVKELFPNVKANVIYTCACTITQDADSTASNGMVVVHDGSSTSSLVTAHSTGKAGERAYKKKTVVFTEEDLSKYVYIYGLFAGTMTWENLMLVEGDYSNTDMPAFQPYYTGLKNAYFKGIKSTGKNLFDKAKLKGTGSFVTFNRVECYKFADGGTTNLVYEDSFKENTQYAFRFRIYRDSGVTNGLNLIFHYADGTTKAEWLEPDTLYGIISASGKTLTKITSQINYNKTAYLDLSIAQMGEGTPLPDYEEYRESKLLFPEAIDTGLGTTIDFENKKILNYGVDIVLTGQENWEHYWYKGGSSPEGVNGVYCYNLFTLPGNKAPNTISDYISTDSIPHPGDFTLPGTMWCGYVGTKNFFWIGILDLLGFTTKGIRLTEEEDKQTAIANFKSYLTQRYADGNPVKIRYISSELQSEISFTTAQKNAGNVYTVWNEGSEKIEGNANETYQVFPTITQKYSIHENPTEAANKAYVNNGLAKKLDKTGGTITGHLVVENGTNTTLPALVVTNNEHTYGLALEDDTYKLGEGSIDNENKFTFNAGEGLPIALRDDSSAFADGELVKWNADGNKLTATGINVAKLSDISRLNALIDGLTDAQIAALNNFAKTLS